MALAGEVVDAAEEGAAMMAGSGMGCQRGWPDGARSYHETKV